MTATSIDGSNALAELMARLTAELDGWTVGTLTVRLVPERTHVGSLQMDVVGDVVDGGGQRCGFFHGYLVPADDLLESWVVLNAIELDRPARGENFARTLVARILNVLDDLGFRRVIVHGFAEGAYLWADAGFTFDHPALPSPDTLDAIVERAERNGALDGIPASDTGQLAMLRTYVGEHADAHSPSALLSFVDNATGDDRDRRKRLVRTVLAGSEWWGVRETTTTPS